ncbi:hypothetical protein [Hyphomicrobium sulfonivorans]|uniref:hypothetical protein n=1 Tax=Hyphomicrobium sulfonivorans TaxID=121290 RepID=UPI0015706350|nr:hypothetical protein [Hyphomicrobium sulfonivorans]MBI1649778.1 hypothetical protein [Hyphomicrobium sulfonivorans]
MAKAANGHAPAHDELIAQLTGERDQLKSELSTLAGKLADAEAKLAEATAKLAALEEAREQAVSRIDWALDSLHNVLESSA